MIQDDTDAGENSDIIIPPNIYCLLWSLIDNGIAIIEACGNDFNVKFYDTSTLNQLRATGLFLL